MNNAATTPVPNAPDADADAFFRATTFTTIDAARADEYEGPDEPCEADYDGWARKF